MGLAKTFLAIGISVILAVFVGYALYVLYESPAYNYTYDAGGCSTTYKCYDLAGNEYATCQESYRTCVEEYEKQTPRYAHARNSFYILIILGIAAIVSGIFLNKLEGVAGGLIGGGVLIVLWSLIYSSDYWYTLNKYLKLVALGIVLVILIYLGYKKIEQKRK